MSDSNYRNGNEKVESFQEGVEVYCAAFGRRLEESLKDPETYLDFVKRFCENLTSGLLNLNL